MKADILFITLLAVACSASHGPEAVSGDPVADPSEEEMVLTGSVENSFVAAYMSAATSEVYPDGIYSDEYPSIVGGQEYSGTATVENRLDRPAPVILTWSPDPECWKQTLRLVSDRGELIWDSLDGEASSLEVYNLVPGTEYRFEVKGEDIPGAVRTVASGKLTVTGQVRMIYADGICNVRDFGGWTSHIAGQEFALRYGSIFRGSRLSRDNSSEAMVTPAGMEVLRSLGIGTELDLREDAEAGNITASVLAAEDYPVVYYRNGKGSWPYFYEQCCLKDAYIDLADKLIASVLGEDGYDGPTPVYFHCSVGADRTGTLAFLIGGLLGMSELDLARDYELTSFYYYTPERWRYDGRWDYPGMVAAVSAVDGKPGLSHEDFYYYFYRGVPGPKGNNIIADEGTRSRTISGARLKAFIKYMTGCPDHALYHLPD